MRRARTQPDTTEGLPGSIATEARIVGLRDFSTLSLEAVEHRRIQLWILTSIMLVSISVGVVVLSIWPTSHGSVISSGPLCWGIVLMSIERVIQDHKRAARLRCGQPLVASFLAEA